MSVDVNVVLGTVPENSSGPSNIPLLKLDDRRGTGDDNSNFARTVAANLNVRGPPAASESDDNENTNRMSGNEADDDDVVVDGDENKNEDDDGDEGVEGEEEEERTDDYISHMHLLRHRRSDKPNIPPTVTVLTHRCGPHADAGEISDEDTIIGRVYLVGTAHFSQESQSDVRQTIRETQPDIVMVELCQSRVAVLALNEETLLEEARSLTTEKMLKIIREAGLMQGVMHILLLSMSAHITRQLGMAPGGEFRAAFQEAQRVPGCRWNLGDRLIQTTMARALGTLSVWQKLRLFWSIIWSHNIQITKEEVEKCKQRDLLEELLREMAGEFPELSRIFVEERDEFMAHTLFALLRHAAQRRREQLGENEPWEPVVIVSVVGMGHVPGIVTNFGKQIDVQELLKIPKTSRWTRCMKIAFKGMIVGVTAYVAYKSALYTYRLFFR